jgi:hypothetical protein
MVETELPPLPLAAPAAERARQYAAVAARLELLLEGEDDFIAAQDTVACELHHAFEFFSCEQPARTPLRGLHVASPRPPGPALRLAAAAPEPLLLLQGQGFIVPLAASGSSSSAPTRARSAACASPTGEPQRGGLWSAELRSEA